MRTFSIGEMFFRLDASDSDSGSNALVQYSIIDGSVPFNVDLQYGNISVEYPGLNHENVIEYFLTVEAFNPFSSRFTATATLLVTVEDINDNTPLFDVNSLEISATESSQVGTTLGQVIATDLDSGSNSVLEYGIQTNTTLLDINPDTGEIILEALLDFETAPVLYIILTANRHGYTSTNRVCCSYIECNRC